MSRLRLLMMIFGICLFTCANIYAATPPENAPIIAGYCEETARENLKGITPNSIEGIWEYPADMVTLAIERRNDIKKLDKFKYQLILVHSEDYSVIPGTILGYIEETAQKDKFYIWIYSDIENGTLSNYHRCAADFDEKEQTIIFEIPKIKFTLRVNFSRFFPTLFRGLGITAKMEEKTLPLGFRKVYPIKESEESQKIYL